MKPIALFSVFIVTSATSAQTNSPALQAYQELLKARDQTITTGTYACFDDDSTSTSFRVIDAMLMSKDTMEAFVNDFKDGVEVGQHMLGRE
jgi:hypothetical protein